MSWLKKLLPPGIQGNNRNNRNSIPEGLWTKCPECEQVLYRTDLEASCYVCPNVHCHHHLRIHARLRIDQLLDAEGREEIGQSVTPVDILKFKDSRKYSERIKDATRHTSETDALVVMAGSIKNLPVVITCFEYAFMGGSMGSVVGERFVRGAQYALDNQIPFICITASGGARMQESLFSLMQMAKTTAIVAKLIAARLPVITVLTDPTMGGVSASFAFIADIVIAEPKALIGFAGPRVIKQTVRETLPEGFQRAEFLLDKGAIDKIVDRRQLRDELAQLLALMMRQPLEVLANS